MNFYKTGRKSVIIIIGLMLVMLITLIGAGWPQLSSTEESSNEIWRGSFSRVLAEFGRTESDFDTIADRVYGQYTFTETLGIGSLAVQTLRAPADLFVYDTGQIFIADTANNRVLGWDSVDFYENGDPPNLVIGQPDFFSNDVVDPPTASSLNQPTALLVDAYGDLYVADTGNNRVLIYISVVDVDGFLSFENGQAADIVIGQQSFTSNMAPNPPNIASMNHPMGIVVDYYENLVVADRDNNRVLIYEPPLYTGMPATRMIGQATNPEATVGNPAGNKAPNPPTATSLNQPSGVAIAATANELYVADTGNNRILIYDDVYPLNGKAEFVIGQPDFTSNTPNNGGVSATSLNGPTGLKLDSADRLLVADTGNNRVLVFVDSLVEATADEVFGQPDFTSNARNNGGLSAASLNAPTGIGTDEFFMDIYIADQGNHRALHYWQPLENPLPQIQELSPGTIQAGSDGFTLDVWGIGIISDTTVQINGQTRPAGDDYFGLMEVPLTADDVAAEGVITFTLTNPAPGGGTSDPFTLTVYTQQSGDLTPDSVMGQAGFTTYYGPFIPTQADNLFQPRGLAIDQNTGRIFVADGGNARVLSWPSESAFSTGSAADLVIGQPDFQTFFSDFVSASTLNYPADLTLDADGNLYVADPQDNRVLIFAAPLSTGMTATLVIGQADFNSDTIPQSATADNINNPLGLAVDSAGNLYVADAAHNRVLIYNSPLTEDTTADYVLGQNGSFTSAEANLGGLSADSLFFPSGLALDSQDNLYVTDQANNRVLRFDAPLSQDTTADQIFDEGFDEGFTAPRGVTLDQANNLFIADTDNNRVLFYHQPAHTDTTPDAIITNLGELVPGTARTKNLNAPYGLAVDPQGNLFIVDTNHNRILGYLQPEFETTFTVYLPLVLSP